MPDRPLSDQNAFSDHLISFGRVLRRLGFDIGPAHMIQAMQAVKVVSVHRKEDVYYALKCTLVHKREERELFDQAFQLFWKAPAKLPEVMKWLLHNTEIPQSTDSQGYHRVQDALHEPQTKEPQVESDEQSEQRIEIEQVVTYSSVEALRHKDFSAFTNDEIAAARRYLARFTWPVPPYVTRRLSAKAKGRKFDVRQTTRLCLRHSGEVIRLGHRGLRKKMRPIVMLCDISGSMERYARMLLHFMYTLTKNVDRVESFVFGTRLTRISRHLRSRDIDESVTAVSREVNDWGGGTKIGDAVKTFNYTWLRRVLRSSSVVLIISDGWDRGDTALLSREMARLSRSCHRIIWLNPLMGYEEYEPLTLGMQAALPYIDDLLPVHNLASLEQLAAELGKLRT